MLLVQKGAKVFAKTLSVLKIEGFLSSEFYFFISGQEEAKVFA